MAADQQTAGAFHVQDHDQWRVTSPSLETATTVGAALDGTAPRRGSDGGWEVTCRAVPLPVMVGCIEQQALMFQLAERAELGWFRLDFAPWAATDVLGAAVVADLGRVGGPSAAVLDLRPLFYQTRNSMLIRFTAASLTPI
ncbi:hypothetical protein ABUW04_16125 [Streptacidiphilus sp. N1-10]|uniref:Uncharacterized protein n=1 Tax=Streptacidiphilus jeojiensis TaxID=3229225 RepID=A0ABV6XNG4_9ACTN